MLEVEILQEICVNHQDLQENQNYIFNSTEKKQLKSKFTMAVGTESQIYSVQLTNVIRNQRIIQKKVNIRTLSKHRAYYLNKNHIAYFCILFINFDKYESMVQDLKSQKKVE